MSILVCAFGAIFLICGLYYADYAFRHRQRLHEGEALSCLFLGALSIVGGIALLIGLI